MIGQQRRIQRFAWLPVTLTGGQRIWFIPYQVVEEYQRWSRWPLGQPDPDALEKMAMCSRDTEFATKCLVDADDIRRGRSPFDEGWRCIEIRP